MTMNNRPFAGRTAAVIDLAKLRSNIANIKSRLKPGVEFIAVMKGDGYRHGIAGLYPTLKECGIDSYAVAIWEEGKMLRDVGATESILSLAIQQMTCWMRPQSTTLISLSFQWRVLRTWLPLQEEPARNRMSR